MRKILMMLMVLLFCCWLNAGYAQDTKLGYISLKDVLDNYKKVEDEEAELVKAAEKKDKERENLVKEIKNLREKIDLLKDQKKEKKQNELDEKLNELKDFTYEMRTSLRQNRDGKFIEIMKEVKDIIKEYGQSRNYNIIIDDTLLLYKDEKLNVTDDVINTLNQRYKK
ncbi:MAG: OmpH family outer membrane protein [Candidatus Omnitrophica bacterium]|nr:OmpH family outer membrane protein [Candidatus Omnitrophota bacterium]